MSITVLFPGGFKPLTGAHMELANRYAELNEVSKVILLIGEKERDGITRNDSMEIFRLLNNNPKIEMQSTAFNSPIMAAYEYLFALPEDAVGKFAMAASTKGDDYVRTKDFIPNVDKYITIGDKKGRTIPNGVDAIELSIDIDPLLFNDGTPISATTLRAAIANHDLESFKSGYPNTNEEIVKQIWKLLTGLSESKYSVEWWKHVMEGAMGTHNKENHDAKIKKLRTFLDSNDKSFIYDFDKFAKTVFGAKIIESVLNENYITRRELSEIEPIIDSFFRKYGIDVDFQGANTHFLDRINDPRNEGTISLDDLEQLFQDLADRYGEQIVKQIQQRRPTAVESDLQFDVPIHMPFMLTLNTHTGKIKLIPRTIKSQRRKWQSNDPRDVVYTIESKTKSGDLITEGGAGGHMSHPYESHALTFGDMKEIIYRALSGKLDIEEAVTEKTDGQNIQVTWKNSQIGFARNKGTVVNPMTTSELQAKFDNRGPISEAFGNAGEDLTEAFSRIPQDKLNSIFKNGRVFANMEIIYPATKNVISYETAVLQFHNLVEYDEVGNIVETDATGGALMQRVIAEANAHMQKTFKIIPPQQVKLGKVIDFEDQQSAFINEVDQLRNLYDLKDTDLVTEYHKAWWANVITTKAQEMNYQLDDSLLNVLVYRWAFADKSTSLTALKKMITDPAFLGWVVEFDKGDYKKYFKQNMEPFESIFLRLGAVVLNNASNFLAVNPSKAVQEIKSELAQLIKELQTSNDIKTLDKLKVELGRIQRLGGFEAIVPSEGIVFVYRGHTYKLTGAFAPVNQILGVLKYSR